MFFACTDLKGQRPNGFEKPIKKRARKPKVQKPWIHKILLKQAPVPVVAGVAGVDVDRQISELMISDGYKDSKILDGAHKQLPDYPQVKPDQHMTTPNEIFNKEDLKSEESE